MSKAAWGAERVEPLVEPSSAEPKVEPLSDRLIAAYTQRYREAARWKALTWVGSAGLFLTGLVFASVGKDAAGLGLGAAGYLLCSRLVLRPEMTRAHRDAVVLQEQYDISVLLLPWNSAIASQPIALVDVEDLARRFRGDAGALSPWYVDGGEASPSVRTLLCQLENAAWGRRDHRRFAVLIAIVLVLSMAATVVVGLIHEVSLASYVSMLAVPALPWLLDLADLAALHWQASARRGEIEKEVTDLWESLPSGAGVIVSTESLRRIQDRIFTVRRSSGRVPSWFYRLYRNRNHEAFQAAAQRMLASKDWRGDA